MDVLVPTLLVLGAQGLSTWSEAGQADKLSVKAIPKPGTALRPGQTVAVEVMAQYVLKSSSAGEVVLVMFVASTGRNLVEPQPSASVQRGTGETRLASEFVVPTDTDRVGLSVILTAEAKDARSAKSKPAAQRIVFYPVR